MTTQYNSPELRRLGNRYYENYQNSTNIQDRKSYLEKAINKYYRAFEEAGDHDERCAAAKNYGTAAFRLADVLEEIESCHLSLILFHYKDAVKYFSKALAFGRLCGKSMDWVDHLMVVYSSCIEQVIDQIHTKLPLTERVQYTEQLIGVMCEDSQMADCCITIAEDLFSAAVVALDAKDYRAALRCLHDCHRPVEECLRLGQGEDSEYIRAEAEIKKTEVMYALCTAESLQAIDIGDKLLDQAVNGSEHLNMELVYDVIDMYKQAAIKTRETEIEMEAVAMSRLGSLYEKVLKIKSRAHDYYRHCMQLVLSLHPKTFNTEGWFIDCSSSLKRYQDESMANIEEKEREARKQCKEKLKAELKELKESDAGYNPLEFLRYIYKRYPPKRPEQTLDEESFMERKSWKKALLNVLTHYHPDKNGKEEHGLEWFMMCEEITKRINMRYDVLKECTED